MPKASPSPTETSHLSRSCMECRRRKLKCDRKVPCANCQGRGKAELCPDGALPSKTAHLQEEIDRLQSRVKELETQLGEKSQRRDGSNGVRSIETRAQEPPNRVGGVSTAGWKPGFGTLVLDSGSARFVGSTAASEWLNQAEDSELLADTPRRHLVSTELDSLADFPLRRAPSTVWPFLKTSLPSRDRTKTLSTIYWDLYTFNYDVVPQAQLDTFIDAFYEPDGITSGWTQETHPHKLALIFIVLAIGSLLSIDTDPQSNLESKRFFELAEVCLSVANFLKEHTLASVQTLHIMANYHVYDDRLRGGDRAWPLGGLAMRLIQAMGLHRDGSTWNLPENVVEERRRVFWETYTEETFQAHCFGRPGGLFERHFDVAYPNDHPAKAFAVARYDLVRVSSRILDAIMSTEPPAYDTVLKFHKDLNALAQAQPEEIKWRPSTTALASHDLPWSETPQADKEALKLSLRQHTLALNIHENILFLLRAYFARALRDNPADPRSSQFREAFAALFDTCQIIIAITQSLHRLHPKVALRHWYFWYHACSAAVCMASIPIVAPLCQDAFHGWQALQSACSLFSMVGPQSRSSMASLALLLRLRSTAFDKMSGTALSRSLPSLGSRESSRASMRPEEEESTRLMGLNTRLIQRQHRVRRPARDRDHPGPTSDNASQGPAIPSPQRRHSDDSWEPNFQSEPFADSGATMFSYDLPLEGTPSQNPHFEVDRQALNFDLDATSFAYLSTMGTAAVAGPPLEASAPPDWNDLDMRFGMQGSARAGLR